MYCKINYRNKVGSPPPPPPLYTSPDTVIAAPDVGAKFPDGGKIWTVEEDKQDDDLTGKGPN